VEAFGSSIYVPIWWPERDRVRYALGRQAGGRTYQVRSGRRSIIGVIGRQEIAERLPWGDWHGTPELEDGLVDTSGDAVRAVVYVGGHTVHLMGYGSEDEVVRAATSLREVVAGQD